MMNPRMNAQEEAKLDAMQRIWQTRRGLSSNAFLEKPINDTDDLLCFPEENPVPLIKQCSSTNVLAPSTFTCSDVESDNELWDHLQESVEIKEFYNLPSPKKSIVLDASTIGDIPAKYTICAVEKHQFPVVGVYIDKRICTGFKYRVRPLPEAGKNPTINKCMFNNRALTLKSIGRGYARRFTFEADKNSLNNNENYFYSDNRQEGYAFELEVVSEGDKFTLFDINGEAQGFLEVLNIEAPEVEIHHSNTGLAIEKHALVKFTGKVEFYEFGVSKPMLLAGTAICVKPKKGDARVVRIMNVDINRQRYTLRPGINKIHRRVTVKGQDINDVPTKYSMTGLEHYEIPVVGTYVDPRVIPGFYYRVRPNDRKTHLFGGRALKLQNIGAGYAKRLTFESDSMLKQDNYLWSDNHPDGLGLEPRALHKGMKFVIHTNDVILGEATVFRVDLPQKEERMEKIPTKDGRFAIQKYIQVDVICHIKLAGLGCGSTEDEYLMRVCGLAVVSKEPGSLDSKVLRVENVGLDSQLLVLFAQTHTELTFLPKN